VDPIHKLLTNTLYIGRWRCNTKSAKTQQKKSEQEVIEVSAPAIIDQNVFSRAQQLLKARNPKVTAPKVTTGPVLLTGLAVCATCDGGMMLRTGTGARAAASGSGCGSAAGLIGTAVDHVATATDA
jgi:uncharacterized Fe-S center protein